MKELQVISGMFQEMNPELVAMRTTKRYHLGRKIHHEQSQGIMICTQPLHSTKWAKLLGMTLAQSSAWLAGVSLLLRAFGGAITVGLDRVVTCGWNHFYRHSQKQDGGDKVWAELWQSVSGFVPELPVESSSGNQPPSQRDGDRHCFARGSFKGYEDQDTYLGV